MSCVNPKPALLVPDSTSSTGQKVHFLRLFRTDTYYDLQKKYGDQLVMIPCGQCPACIEQRTKNWAVRCCLEAGQFDNNCFVTLTYNPANLPKKGVQIKDVQRFIKNLRNKFGKGIRYFGCAEYGSLGRAHYHIILFNFFPPDAKCFKQSPYGGFYYCSKVLNSLWRTKKKLADGKYHQLGFVSVGDVSFNSCAYVARYCMKKIGKELGVVGVNKEFSFMSRKPGIGENYFRDHFDSLLATDTIYGRFGGRYTVSSFRYFDKLIERVDPEKLKDLKAKRVMFGEMSVASELLRRSLPDMEHYLMDQQALFGEKYNRLRRHIS